MNEIKFVENPSTLDGLKVVNNIGDTVETLKNGEAIARFEFGNSMMPIFRSGQYARLTPLKEEPREGDAVFCNVDGCWMTHMVIRYNRHTGYALIGSTHGAVYGWTKIILAIARPMNYIENPSVHVDDLELTP